MARKPHPDPVIEDLFRQLRQIKADYQAGLCDAEGRPTAFGLLVRSATKIEVDE